MRVTLPFLSLLGFARTVEAQVISSQVFQNTLGDHWWAEGYFAPDMNTSPFTPEGMLFVVIDPSGTGAEEAMVGDDILISRGAPGNDRVRLRATYEQVSLSANATLLLRITKLDPDAQPYDVSSQVIADTNTAGGNRREDIVSIDIDALTWMVTCEVVVRRATGTGSGSARVVSAEVSLGDPTCGDAVVDPLEACDTGLRRSNTLIGACRLDCTRVVDASDPDAGLPMPDAGTRPDAGTTLDGGLDAGPDSFLPPGGGDCAVSHDATRDLPLAAVLLPAIALLVARRTRRRR
jgi:hypothetical protein